VKPSRGVITLSGYGISVRVDRGHLVMEDGIGATRTRTRLARVGHGLRRLVIIGGDGFVSLAALQWLADQNAAFVMLNRDGSVLAATGPVGPRDARLRRVQAVAHHGRTAIVIARELIARKLMEQERMAATLFHDRVSARSIAEAREALRSAEAISAIRNLESQAALAYWSMMRTVPVEFPSRDLPRIPEHWRVFGTRSSPLTNSPRLSVNPSNAMLNYLYALLEAEARLAAVAVGLDPGLGFMHADTRSRDSLACDLMEPIRPQVDAYVLNWLRREPLRRDWLFERRDGNCRLMAPFACRLSETSATWARAVAPIAEWVAKALSSPFPEFRRRGPATHLTQQHRRDAKGAPEPTPAEPPAPMRVCKECGAATRGARRCKDCLPIGATERLLEGAKKGRVASQRPAARSVRRRVSDGIEVPNVRGNRPISRNG
jgi:CRISPR-associated protein Cas1